MKLANNNPNDNEANSAARRVCRMIEEGKFIFSETKTAQDKVNVPNDPAKNAAPWARHPAETWNDVKRSEEPEFRSSRPTPPFTGGNRGFNAYKSWMGEDWMNEIFKNLHNVPPSPPYNRPPRSPDFSGDKKMRCCSRCGLEKETGYIGNLFVCSDCQWKEYQERNK